MPFIPYNPSAPVTQPDAPKAPNGFLPYTPTMNLGTPPTPQAPQEQSTPLLTGQSTSFGDNLGTSLKDVTVGAGRSLVRGTRDVMSSIQNLGKGFLKSGFGIDSSNMGIQSIDNSTVSGAQVNEQLQPKSQGEKIGGYLETAAELGAGLSGGTAENLINKGKGLLQDVKTARNVGTAINDASKVTEMVAPKLTAKEAKVAMSQGRVIPGTEPTLFKSGTPQTVLPSNKTVSATDTIIKNIPGAPKMNPTELYTAVDKNITSTAKELRPAMEATPIKPETVQKINDDWTALKKTQMAEAPATEEANVAKRQAKFESFLQKSGNEHQGHLWDTRIEYDNSIPQNVKKANINSPESLQLQKQEWLQNRDVLNKAINDTVNGMGKTSQDAFKKMTDLYEAKTNLLSKAKGETAVKPSKIKQFTKNHPIVTGAVAGSAATATGLPVARLLRGD